MQRLDTTFFRQKLIGVNHTGITTLLIKVNVPPELHVEGFLIKTKFLQVLISVHIFMAVDILFSFILDNIVV